MKSYDRLLAAGTLLVLSIAPGCGSTRTAGDDAAPPADAAQVVADSGSTGQDGAPGPAGDAGASASPPGAEVTSGGMHLEGATYKMDVQVGHPVSQERMQGSQTTLEGDAVVKP
jgi:hypothetical protein